MPFLELILNGARSTVLRGRRAGFLRYSNDPLTYLARLVQNRACFERTPFLCRAATGRFIGAPVGLLSSTEESWNLYGCYGPPGMLSSTVLHPVTSTHIGGRRQAVVRTLPGCWSSVGRMLGEHPQTYWLLTESGKAPTHMSSELRPTPVSVLTGAERLVQRAPPEFRPKCDRVDFKHKIRSTPGRMWNSATFGRSTNSAGDRWICDVGITKVLVKSHSGLRYFLRSFGWNLVQLLGNFQRYFTNFLISWFFTPNSQWQNPEEWRYQYWPLISAIFQTRQNTNFYLHYRNTLYTGWPRKNSTTLIVKFKDIINNTELIFI